jgi:membrane-associated phospholipid phosphatase
MNPGKFDQPAATRLRVARLLTDALNPFLVFTTLYTLVAYGGSNIPQATLYVAVELAAAAFVAGYVLLLRRRRRVGDFWISARHQRLAPALVLLTTFAVLLASLALLGAPGTLLLTTLSMGLASAAVATTTLFWKASAHSAVTGHAAAAGLLVLGLPGLLFALVLPAVLWSRVAVEAHTPAQVLSGAGIGAAFAAVFLV